MSKKTSKSKAGPPRPAGSAQVKKSGWQTGSLSARQIRILAIFLLTFILYGNTLTHDYALDDKSVIINNPLTHLGISGIKDVFLHPQYFGAINQQTRLYRPVPMATHAIEYSLFGENPFTGHLVNVLLYALLCILVYHVFSVWTGEKYPALPFIAALFFLAHPIHTEVVANIKGRDELLTLIFYLFSVVLCFRYIRKNTVASLTAAMLAYSLALLSKENALPFLAIIPASLFCFTNARGRRILVVFLLLALVTTGYMTLRYFIFRGFNQYHLFRSYFQLPGSRAEGLATATGMFLDYIRLLAFPHPLVWNYSFDRVSLMNWSGPKAIIALALIFSFILYILIRLPRKKFFPSASSSFCLPGLSFRISWPRYLLCLPNASCSSLPWHLSLPFPISSSESPGCLKNLFFR